MKDLFKGCWTIPNLLSVIRILLIPVFAVLFYKQEYGWAILTLVLSGLSDFFDGKIARKFNTISISLFQRWNEPVFMRKSI